MVSLYPRGGRVSSRDLGNLNIFVLGRPRGDDDPLGIAKHPTIVAQVIDDLASPLVGLLVVVEGSIGLDDPVTELTEADDVLAAVAVAHTTIIGIQRQKSKHFLENSPENIALMGLLGITLAT